VRGNDSCAQKRVRSSTILTRRRPSHHPFVVYHRTWASWTLKLYSITLRKFELVSGKNKNKNVYSEGKERI
jgi:hypothetical protein